MKTDEMKHLINTAHWWTDTVEKQVRCIEILTALEQRLAESEAREAVKGEALCTLMQWVTSWDSPCTEDAEWPLMVARYEAALAGSPQGAFLSLEQLEERLSSIRNPIPQDIPRDQHINTLLCSLEDWLAAKIKQAKA